MVPSGMRSHAYESTQKAKRPQDDLYSQGCDDYPTYGDTEAAPSVAGG
jgi:hypothetical protein